MRKLGKAEEFTWGKLVQAVHDDPECENISLPDGLAVMRATIRALNSNIAHVGALLAKCQKAAYMEKEVTLMFSDPEEVAAPETPVEPVVETPAEPVVENADPGDEAAAAEEVVEPAA